MGKRIVHILILLISCMFAFQSCTEQQQDRVVPHVGNSAYYWRTTWQLSDAERSFVTNHAIKRIYLRLFDVVQKYEASDVEKQGRLLPMPEATLHFNEPYDLACEVVPVVYIMDDCFAADSLLAQKIVRRVAQFCETNDLKWNEVQFDCDWRESTRGAFFRFLETAKAELAKMGNYRTSATIRLHQFAQPTPPVDYGMLMCYNTGYLYDSPNINCILQTSEVKKFAGRLKNYELPLSVGYPVFSWKRLFRNGKFVALLQGVDLNDTISFQKCEGNVYRVERSLSVSSPDQSTFGLRLFAGDTVKYDYVPADTIMAVKSILENQRRGIHNQVVIYSLNENDITKYTRHEIETIYTTCK